MITPIKIAELEVLDAKATQGPWSITYEPISTSVERTGYGAMLQRPRRSGCMIDSQSVHHEVRRDGYRTLLVKRGPEPQPQPDPEIIAAARNALPALLRLARACDRYAWMLSKDGPGEDEEHVVEAIVAEWKAARAAFDFTTEEAPS